MNKENKILVILIFLLLTLSGCENNKATRERGKESGYKEVCINGITYYQYYGFSGYKAYFSTTPKINSEKLDYVRCNNSETVISGIQIN